MHEFRWQETHAASPPLVVFGSRTLTMRRIQAYVPDFVYRDCCALTQHRGVPLSRVVHQLVVAALTSGAAADTKDRAELVAQPRDGPRRQINISIDHVLADAVGERARKLGTSRAGWVAAVVAAELGRPPRLPTEALQALSTSNRQLWSIGTLLNQIARGVNTDLHAGVRATMPQRFDELMAAVVAKVDEHTQQVAAFVAAARHRPGQHACNSRAAARRAA
jgi:hypothetical protein